MNPLLYYSTTIIFLAYISPFHKPPIATPYPFISPLYDRNLSNTQSRWDIAWLLHKIFQTTSNLKEVV